MKFHYVIKGVRHYQAKNNPDRKLNNARFPAEEVGDKIWREKRR